MSEIDVGIPAGDGAIFRVKNEQTWARFPIFADDKVIRIRAAHAVEDIACWGRWASPTPWRWDGDYERHTRAVALIEGRHTCAIVRNPPGARGAM